MLYYKALTYVSTPAKLNASGQRLVAHCPRITLTLRIRMGTITLTPIICPEDVHKHEQQIVKADRVLELLSEDSN